MFATVAAARRNPVVIRNLTCQLVCLDVTCEVGRLIVRTLLARLADATTDEKVFDLYRSFHLSSRFHSLYTQHAEEYHRVLAQITPFPT